MSAHLTGADVGYTLPDGTVLFSGLHFSFAPVRTGLVGPNGAGKSTLLDLLSGRRAPTHGTVVRAGRVAYLPQRPTLPEAATVADALGCRHELEALARIDEGRGTPDDLDAVAHAWDLPERIARAFDRLGLDVLDAGRPVGRLSGGEQMRVRFAGLLLDAPDFLLLDEPTNHLDRAARAFVYDLVSSWPKGLVVVSHDRALLGRVDQIAELDAATGLRFYGGDYAFYRSQREVERAAAERTLGHARLALDDARQTAREAAERQARREAAGARRGRRTGVSAMAMGILKRRGEYTAGALKDRHEKKVEQAEAAVAAARALVPPAHQIVVDLARPVVPAQKRMVACDGVNYRYPGAAPLWDEPITFEIVGPERVSLQGPNGSGKSTLLDLVCGRRTPSEGTVYTGTTRIGVLDQHVALLDDAATLLDNLRRHAPSRPEHELRILLGRFLFPGEAVFKRADVLSGGERIRAGLACLLAADQAPELLVLDEPTNNLDLPGLEAVASALRAYAGTLVAVSHDAAFLEDIGVTREIGLRPSAGNPRS